MGVASKGSHGKIKGGGSRSELRDGRISVHGSILKSRQVRAGTSSHFNEKLKFSRRCSEIVPQKMNRSSDWTMINTQHRSIFVSSDAWLTSCLESLSQSPLNSQSGAMTSFCLRRTRVSHLGISIWTRGITLNMSITQPLLGCHKAAPLQLPFSSLSPNISPEIFNTRCVSALDLERAFSDRGKSV